MKVSARMKLAKEETAADELPCTFAAGRSWGATPAGDHRFCCSRAGTDRPNPDAQDIDRDPVMGGEAGAILRVERNER